MRAGAHHSRARNPSLSRPNEEEEIKDGQPKKANLFHHATLLLFFPRTQLCFSAQTTGRRRESLSFKAGSSCGDFGFASFLFLTPSSIACMHAHMWMCCFVVVVGSQSSSSSNSLSKWITPKSSASARALLGRSCLDRRIRLFCSPFPCSYVLRAPP